jgi:hypothetical protein
MGKETVTILKRQPTEGEKIFAWIYRELNKLSP